jgi:hypothetical protein
MCLEVLEGDDAEHPVAGEDRDAQPGLAVDGVQDRSPGERFLHRPEEQRRP